MCDQGVTSWQQIQARQQLGVALAEVSQHSVPCPALLCNAQGLLECGVSLLDCLRTAATLQPRTFNAACDK